MSRVSAQNSMHMTLARSLTLIVVRTPVGPHLYTVYPHGSTDKLPYVTMGSGSLAAMSIFEAEFKENMEEEEAKALVAKAIRSGIFNDLGSGSNVDLRVIRKDGTVEFRNCETPNDVAPLRAKVKQSGMYSALCFVEMRAWRGEV